MRVDRVRPLGRCLVTGAGGFVGRRLAAALGSRATSVEAWTRERVELTDPEAVTRAMRACRPDTVFHLASPGVAASAAHDPANVCVELKMVANLVAALPAGVRLIRTGSMAEYGCAGILNEELPCRPRTAYAIGKHAATQFLSAYAGDRGIEACTARLFGVYGPGESPGRFFPGLLAALRAGQPFSMSDGRQLRDFSHVDDVAAALISIAQERCLPSIVNVGTGQAVAVGDVALWICASLGADPKLLRFGDRPRSPGDEDWLQADVHRLKKLIGSTPPARLRPGLEPGRLFAG